MMSAAHAASRRRKLSIRLHRWHRRIGVLASVFLIWMAVSGWLLNHTGALNLARHPVHVNWVLQRYGVKATLPEHAFIAASHWLAATPEATFLDGRSIATSIGPSTNSGLAQPLGMVANNSMLFVASAKQLKIFSPEGAAIDSIDTSLLPIANIARIGNGCSGVVIENDNKMFASSDGVNWQACRDSVSWSAPVPLTAAQQAIIEPLLQSGISIERVLLDLHSGRFLGTWGPYFVDVLGAGLVVLGLSGVWMFAHQRRHRQKRLH
jgi:hypothetical protein